MKNRILLILLAVMLAVSMGLVGCGGQETPEVTEYTLTISSTEGGSAIDPGEGAFAYDEGEVVNLVADADEGYEFVNWTGNADDIGDVEDASTTITMNDDYSITATFAVKQYTLVIHSTEGGSVTTPGEDAYTYDKGEVVNLVAVADEGYVFINWAGDVSTIADVDAASTIITMNSGYSVTANFAKGIWDWYDLDAVRDNLDGSYILMKDLHSATAGHTELASPTANGGKGWEPIGNLLVDSFAGSLHGQGYEIRDVFVDRPDQDFVGLFSSLARGGVVKNLGVVNAEVTGNAHVGGLAGHNSGSLDNVYLTGVVTGGYDVAGLAGSSDGSVSDSYSAGSLIGNLEVGGLAGWNCGTVSNSYSTATVTGGSSAGGLVGFHCGSGTVTNSYYVGSVTGERNVGGLVGNCAATLSNSHYSWGEVLINGNNMITIGALFDEDFNQWLANDKFLDVNERLSQEDGYYLISDVDDFKELLAFGQNGSFKFRLQNDLDLVAEPNFYIPYLSGEFDGDGHTIANLHVSFDFISQVGLFGYLACGGIVTGLNAENVYVEGDRTVGALVGESDGTVSNSYFTGAVAGHLSVGGLVGDTGGNAGGVSNSYYNYQEVLINGRHMISLGALSGEDFEQWLANGKFLDIDERLSQEDGYYLINDVSDFKQLLAFGQDDSLKFRLVSDLDLTTAPDFYIPYLAGEFDGDGRTIRNLTLDRDAMLQIGLFGYVAPSAIVSELGAVNVDIAGGEYVGGVAGWNDGTVSDCYSTGSVAGKWEQVAGLVGHNHGTVSGCHFIGSVTGSSSCANLGGLVGMNSHTVSDCYSTGVVTNGGGPTGGLIGSNFFTVSNSYCTSSVTGNGDVGGLVGYNGGTVSDCYSVGRVIGVWGPTGGLVGSTGWDGGSVSNSLWDTQTSGQSTSADGTGQTTAQMKSISTFTNAGWDIVAVADPSMRNTTYIWNIVDGQTYPFLSWES